MRVGTLVKHIELGYIGICVFDRTQQIQRLLGNQKHWVGGRYAIRWVTENKWDWYTECELEVLCK